jgi:phosphoserine aminotransferase
LPLPVLEKAQQEMVDFNGTGMSVMELSHRSKDYEAVHNAAIELFRELFHIPANYKILLLQGGASHQFAMIPLNLLKPGKSADYIVSGYWSQKAVKEAKAVGSIKIAGTTESVNFNRIPKQEELKLDPAAVYCHITSNNTIFGTQWKTFPKTGSVPLACDMSSDILSRAVDWSGIGIAYAGAQKNLGPSGLTVVVMREDMLGLCRTDIPVYFQYGPHVEANSLYNTPPCYSIYIFKLVLDWVKGLGGLAAIEKRNQDKVKMLYGAIDAMPDFYKGTVEKESRSAMNVTFRLPSEALEETFIKEAKAAGFVGIKGHRSVGGIRVSMYNASEPAGIKALTDFMKVFADKNK